MAISVRIVDTFRKGSRTYFNSSRLFPEKFRDDVFILYAFVRTADDLVDVSPVDKKGYRRFKRLFLKAFKGEPADDSIIDSFVQLMARKRIPLTQVEDFFTSMELDLEKVKCKTRVRQRQYLRGSAEVIGLMMNRIFGVSKTLDKQASYLGRAMQLINWVRDIDEDNRLGRQYFTDFQLKKHGLSSLQLSVAQANPQAFEDFVRKRIDEYLLLQRRASSAFALLPKAARVPVMTAADMYAWTAKKIKKDPFIVYREKVKPSTLRIIVTGLKHKVFS